MVERIQWREKNVENVEKYHKNAETSVRFFSHSLTHFLSLHCLCACDCVCALQCRIDNDFSFGVRDFSHFVSSEWTLKRQWCGNSLMRQPKQNVKHEKARKKFIGKRSSNEHTQAYCWSVAIDFKLKAFFLYINLSFGFDNRRHQTKHSMLLNWRDK